MIFFFFKQKTAYDMRISDWSSDVCSSDLHNLGHRNRDDAGLDARIVGRRPGRRAIGRRDVLAGMPELLEYLHPVRLAPLNQLAHAAFNLGIEDRKSVV